MSTFFSGDYNGWPLSKHAHQPVQAGLPSTLIIKISSKLQKSSFNFDNQNIIKSSKPEHFPSQTEEGFFGSKFVTVVITGNKEGDVEMMAYQVNQTLKLINTKKDRYYIESHRSTQKKINYIFLMSWQVSNQCMALVNDKIIVPTKVGALMTEQ